MKTIRIQSRVAAFVGATALMLQISPVMAGSQHDNNRPVEITFTKWGTSPTAMEGFAEGYISGPFVGHVFHGNASANGHVIRLEAMYEVEDAERPFVALIRGGAAPGSVGLLDGFILNGWRTGAPVHVEFKAIRAPSPTESGCEGAPPGITCFQGTIYIGRVPTRNN